MQLLSIGVLDKSDYIWSQLQQQYNEFEDSDIYLDIEQPQGSQTSYIICNLNNNNSNINFISENIRLTTINVLTDYIINEYEEKFLTRIINNNYCYFSQHERQKILQIALRNLQNTNDDNILNNLYVVRRKNIIIKRLMEYLDTNTEINIDGFVTFRLQEYFKELENVVEKAVDDYLMEKEYEEFIKLLKYFVEVQEPKLEIIHIIVKADNKYVLMDENKNEITNQCINDFMSELREGEINYDDLLVSSLITLAPKNIIIHGVESMHNKELLNTIQNVFLDKVSTCKECELCIPRDMFTRSPR